MKICVEKYELHIILVHLVPNDVHYFTVVVR